MLNSDCSGHDAPDDQAVGRIVSAGPHGALTIAGIAVTIVWALWLAFYFLVFLPRGPLQ